MLSNSNIRESNIYDNYKMSFFLIVFTFFPPCHLKVLIMSPAYVYWDVHNSDDRFKSLYWNTL